MLWVKDIGTGGVSTFTFGHGIAAHFAIPVPELSMTVKSS
jgi:hypothetical protein